MEITAEQQRAIDDLCRRCHVLAPRMFGSAAVGLEGPTSDVDLLVEFTPGKAPGAFEPQLRPLFAAAA